MAQAREWMARLARTGFAVKGMLYLVLGGLALRAALGQGGELTDARGAVTRLLLTPYGKLVVGALAGGLAFYAAWRYLEAFADANDKGRDASGLASRAVYALSGTVYGLLAADAAILAVAPQNGGSGDMELPAMITGSELAQWMAMLVALVLMTYGALQVWRAFSRRLSDQLGAYVAQRAGGWPMRVSRAGIAGRGVVLITMGVILMRRASQSVDSAAQTDTGDSLRLLAALPTGEWLLVGVAAGLMAYGVFQLVHAKYRRISPP